jgi:DNA-binding transcriptional ArsR family regulator
MSPTPETSPVPELDPVIHAQARLRVVSALSMLRQHDRIAFPRLQDILKMTPGNLSVHLRKLEDAGYVEVTKTHHGRTPTTLIQLSLRGRLAFDDYTTAVRSLLDGPRIDGARIDGALPDGAVRQEET